jgi:hypothetical protein
MKRYTSNDNGNKGIVESYKVNEYDFQSAKSYNRQSKIGSFVGLLLILAIVAFIAINLL